MSRVVSMLCSGRWSVLKGIGTGTVLAHPAVTTSPGPQGLTRWFGQSPCLAGSPADLDKAKERLGTLTEDPGNDVKLKLYAIFKQATVGPCDTKRPGAMDFVGRAKWDAWNAMGKISQSDAINQYSQLVDELVGSSSPPPTGEGSADSATSDYKEIIVTQEGGALTILLNRPNKYNALNYPMYTEVQQALINAGENESVVVAMITGAGDYYCSGNDLSNFMNIPPEGPEKLAAEAKTILRDFVSTFINFPKPLIAAVNGPAIGISVTLLGLCDLVYASDSATFHTPFMTLGQSPEGCSSMLFPQIMGPAKANEVLLAGRKLTAQEAYERNLVSEVFPAGQFQGKVKEIVSNMAKLPPQSLCLSKQLLRDVQREALENANLIECELLEKRWLSDECREAIINFMQRKTK